MCAFGESADSRTPEAGGPDSTVIDADDFRALARSAPWLWRSLELVWDAGPRVWLDRPDRQVVLTNDGLHAQESRAGDGIASFVTRPDARVTPSGPDDFWFASELSPRRRQDGLVVERPDGPFVQRTNHPRCGATSPRRPSIPWSWPSTRR